MAFKERERDVVEEAADVGVDDTPVPLVAEHADTGDGAVDAAVRSVGEAGFEKLFLKGLREAAGDSGLEDAVADGGDEQGAVACGVDLGRGRGVGLRSGSRLGFGRGPFFNDDASQRERAVGAVPEFAGQFRAGGGGGLGELVDGDGVHPGTAVVFLDAGEGVEEFAGVDGRPVHVS